MSKKKEFSHQITDVSNLKPLDTSKLFDKAYVDSDKYSPVDQCTGQVQPDTFFREFS